MTKFQQSMADLEALTARRHEIIKASLTYKFPDAALFPQLDYHHDDNLQYPYDILKHDGISLKSKESACKAEICEFIARVAQSSFKITKLSS